MSICSDSVAQQDSKTTNYVLNVPLKEIITLKGVSPIKWIVCGSIAVY